MSSSDQTSTQSSKAPVEAPIRHGGDLGAARRLFPNAPEPMIDLSTGVNPHPYPMAAPSAEDFAHLPEPAKLAQLMEQAAAFYGAPSPDHVVAAPGSQILMALIADWVPKGRAAILSPTYAEHARIAAHARYKVDAVSTPEALAGANLAVVVNPNNPDGRIVPRESLLMLAQSGLGQGGMLVADEAFMDAGPAAESLCGQVEDVPVTVLRSFGKFFGLAGLRLSFAIAGKALAAHLRARLGPWPVSGCALTVGSAALADEVWIGQTRKTLKRQGERLQGLLNDAGLEIVGGTSLFCLVRCKNAEALFNRLGEAGLFTRLFEENNQMLRLGLPGTEESWQRLARSLKMPDAPPSPPSRG